MAEKDENLHQARFLSLVLSLHNSAWIAMGKIASPVTGKVEKDIEAARGSIDLIETLKYKARGNLTPEEENVLANCLSALQLNYVEEAARESKKPEPAAAEKSEAGKEAEKQAGGGAGKEKGTKE